MENLSSLTKNYENFDTFHISSFIVSKFYENENVFTIVQIVICIIGLVLNSLTIDVSGKIPVQTSATKWMRYLSCWENCRLALAFFLNTSRAILGYNLTTQTEILCKLFSYIFWLSLLNSSAHLVCLAIDRALCITFPIWHFKKDWNKLISFISSAIILFHCILLVPVIYAQTKADDTCKLVSEKYAKAVTIYQILLSTLFSAVGHFVMVLASSFVFIIQLRKRKKKLPTHVEASAKVGNQSLNRNEDSHAGGTRISESFETRNCKLTDENRLDVDVIDRSQKSVTGDVFGRGPIFISKLQPKIPTQNNQVSIHKTLAVWKRSEEPSASLNGSKIDIIAKSSVDVDQFQTAESKNKNRDLRITDRTTPENKPSYSGEQTLSMKKSSREEKPGKLEPENKKNSASLSSEDWNVVKTVFLVCVWYLVTTWIASMFYLAATFTPKSDEFGMGGKTVLYRVSRLMTIVYSSFNFFFYIRGNTFRETFIRRWMPKLLSGS